MILVPSRVTSLYSPTLSNYWVENRNTWMKRLTVYYDLPLKTLLISFFNIVLWLKVYFFSTKIAIGRLHMRGSFRSLPVPENTCTTCCNLDQMAVVLETAWISLVSCFLLILQNNSTTRTKFILRWFVLHGKLHNGSGGMDQSFNQSINSFIYTILVIVNTSYR